MAELSCPPLSSAQNVSEQKRIMMLRLKMTRTGTVRAECRSVERGGDPEASSWTNNSMGTPSQPHWWRNNWDFLLIRNGSELNTEIDDGVGGEKNERKRDFFCF